MFPLHQLPVMMEGKITLHHHITSCPCCEQHKTRRSLKLFLMREGWVCSCWKNIENNLRQLRKYAETIMYNCRSVFQPDNHVRLPISINNDEISTLNMFKWGDRVKTRMKKLVVNQHGRQEREIHVLDIAHTLLTSAHRNPFPSKHATTLQMLSTATSFYISSRMQILSRTLSSPLPLWQPFHVHHLPHLSLGCLPSQPHPALSAPVVCDTLVVCDTQKYCGWWSRCIYNSVYES